MVSRRRNTPEQQQREAEFAAMDPRLRAIYGRMRKRELASREEMFGCYASFLANGIPDSRGRRIRTAVIRRWVRELRVFAFHHRGHYHFPAFQFAGGEPKPVIAEAPSLGSPVGWLARDVLVRRCQWWLEAGTPEEMLDVDPDAVIEAAKHANDVLSD